MAVRGILWANRQLGAERGGGGAVRQDKYAVPEVLINHHLPANTANKFGPLSIWQSLFMS